MTAKGLKYLSDILMAISLIEDFTKNITDFSFLPVLPSCG